MHKTLSSKRVLSVGSLLVAASAGVACSGNNGGGGSGGAGSGSGGVLTASGGALGSSGGATGSGGTLTGSGGALTGSGGALTGSGGAGGGASGGAGGGTSGGATGSGGTVSSICPYTEPTDPATFPENWTAADVTEFNSNGGWTWYNDERVVVDVEAGKIVLSSAASNASSQSSNRSIDVVIHDLATGQNDKHSLGELSYSDDHNNGGIVIKAPGEYFIAYAHHNVDCNTYWANYSGGNWSQTQIYGWGQHGCTPDQGSTAGTNTITYNNVWRMSSENGALYNFIRSIETSPSFLYSDDNGASWELAGRLTSTPQVGYNAGYYKYWGNGVDRIDFFATESHPRDSDTSVYHGYVQGGKSYDSFGEEIDGDIFDDEAPQITDFTLVFGAGSQASGVTLHRLWNLDVVRYEDGTIGALWQGREIQCPHDQKNSCDPKHHYGYSRFDGTGWTSTRLVKGGRTLYRNKSDWWEEDYLGGAALDPDDPHIIYVSANIDPRDDTTDHGVNEIFKGVTCDDGASFKWTPMTMNSANENLRPVVPKWDATNSALLWFRGNYQTAQMYSAEVVGIISER